MNKNVKLSKKCKRIATTVLSVYAFSLVFTGTSLLAGADTPTDIVAPASGFNAVAQYEFNDENNLGKDSLGNYDLVAQNVKKDVVNGGVALKDGGILYAPDLDGEGTDVSDLVKGSYSVSMRVYLRSVSDGANYLVTTGSYGSNFQTAWSYQGLAMSFGGSQSAKFGTSATDLGGKAMLDETFAWYRITMIYNESNLSFRVLASKEGDSTYTFDGTKTLTSAVTFGGHANTLTIGAQSKFGTAIAQQVNTTISDSATAYTVYPNISELRLYSGVIDDTEIAAIAKYDSDKLSAGKTGYDAVAHYEFKYPNNLGKDSLGNYDLVATDGVALDSENGGVTLGGTSGVLYAPALYPKKIGSKTDGYVDVSDLLKGSYSVSMRAYLRSVDDGANYLVATGSYGSNFQAAWSYQGLGMSFGGSQSAKFGTSSTDLGGKAMLNTTFAWYRITMIYDESNLSFRMLVTKEGDSAYTFDASTTLTSAVTFGGHANTLTIGGQSNFGTAVAQHVSSVLTADQTTVYPNISDFRLYLGVIDATEIAAIAKYDADNLALNDTANAVEKDVKPIVWYEFNDVENLGKDSMGNFDLKVKGSITHDEENGSVTFAKANGAFLYAPYYSGTLDFSDLFKGGYTVSYTVNADNTVAEGNRYAISTSSYGAGFCVLGSNSGYRVVYSAGGDQTHSVRYETGSHKNTWVNITVTMDKNTSKLAFYIDGLLFDEKTVDDYQGFTKEDIYSFVIGGQGTGAGKNGAQYFEGSIADVKVYDFALSSKNVKDIYDKADTATPFASVATYNTVEEIAVDTTDLDLVIKKNNSVEDVLSELPSTVKVTDRNEQEETCSVVWLGFENGTVRGYVKGASAANAECAFAEVKLSYVIDFPALTNGTFEEVKLNGEAYTGGEIDFGVEHTLTFKINANNGYKISSVAFNNQRIAADNTGLYTVAVDDYSQVAVTIAPEEYKITYVLNNGQNNEEQIYGYGESVELADYFTKEGYVFEGWYDNEALEGEAVTSIDSLNPEDVTLYAKWVEAPASTDSSSGENSDNGSTGGSTGCKGSVGGSLAVVSLCFVGVAVLRRRKGER